MVTRCSEATARKNQDIYILRFITVTSGGYKTGFVYSDSVSSIFSVKNSLANAIKLLAVILNLASDKPEKLNISLLFGCCLGTLHYHKTKRGSSRETSLQCKSFIKTNLRGLRFL